MKIYSEGFRRVTAEGKFDANQNSKLRFGVLISVACIGSLSLISKADGKDFTPTIVDEINGDLNLFSKIEVSHVIEHRTIDSTIDINSHANCEVEFSRQATSLISITFDGGSANWESPVVWENMDVYWDAPEASNTPYLAKVYNRNASSSISLSASVGTADYGSSVFWEFMDVNWDDEDTSTSNQFFSTVHNRNASAGISISTTVGQAGWASDFVWEGLDINWDDQIAGQIHQGNASISTELLVSVNGEINAIYSLSTTALFSLSTNINSEIIAGWNSDTTLIENLTRNWETS